MVISVKKTIRFIMYLLPLILMFGSYIVFFKVPGLGYLNAERLSFYILIFLGITYFINSGGVSIRFGMAGKYALFFILMLLYATVSLLWVKNMWESYSDSYMYMFAGVFLVLFITAACNSFDDIMLMLRICTVCYIITVLLGLLEIHSGHYLLTQNRNALFYKNPYGLNFPYAAFYNTNDYAAYVVLYAPLAAFCISYTVKGLKGKLAAAAAVICGLYTVLNASARICYFAAAVFAVSFLAVLFSKPDMKKYSRQLLAAAAVAVFIFLALVMMSVIKINVFTGEIASIKSTDNSVEVRNQLMDAGLSMLARYFWAGVGVGNSVQLVPYYSSLSAINLHNLPLQILTEYGVLIFAMYLLTMLSIGIRLFRWRGRSPVMRMWACVCFGSLCSFQLADFASSDATHINEFWLIMAIWVASVKVLYQRTPVTEVL